MATRLTKRSDGRYCKQITIGLKNGKPVKKSLYGKTIKEVEKKARDFEIILEKGIILDNSKVTLHELSTEFCKLKKSNLGYNSKTSQKTLLNNINNYFELLKVKDAREYHIQMAINEMCENGNYCKADRVLHFLNEVFNYACSLDIIYKNPCNNIKIKYKSKEKRILTELEKRKIIKSELSLKDKAFIYLLQYSGMRRGEIFALSYSDIDFIEMSIKVNKTVIDFNGKAILQGHTKTDAGTRIIPIFEPLILPLQNYLNDCKSEILFPNAKGSYYSSSSINFYWKNLRKKIGLSDDVTPHMFRHNFISECYKAGIQIKLIQKWVGHSDINTTLNVYTHLDEEMLMDSRDMNQYFNQSKISQK